MPTRNLGYINSVIFLLFSSYVSAADSDGFHVSDETNQLYLDYLSCANSYAKEHFYETVELDKLAQEALSSCQQQKRLAVEALKLDAENAKAMNQLQLAEQELENDVVKHLKANISQSKFIETREWRRYGP